MTVYRNSFHKQGDNLVSILDYINNYGTYSFKEKPFNEIDNIIFSQLTYVDYENIVTDSSYPFELSYVAKRYYELHSENEIKELIKISFKALEILKACAITKRFGDAHLCYYVNNVNDEIDKQFSAINFILNDGSLLVAFRGTDITVTGVKESAMLSYMFPVPAQIEALHYFQETAMRHKGEVRACGHSKGGNLAVFASVNCSNSLKNKIVGVYENDAPGFPKWFFERADYLQIKDKITVIAPEGSVIGRMLFHDKQPVIVKSTNYSGIKQHQVSSWIINDDYSLDTADAFDVNSDFISEYINNLIDYIGDEDLELFFDTIEYVVENTGIDDFYDLKSFEVRKVFNLIDSLKVLDDSQKERFKLILKRTVSDFAKFYFSSKSKEFITKNPLKQ